METKKIIFSDDRVSIEYKIGTFTNSLIANGKTIEGHKNRYFYEFPIENNGKQYVYQVDHQMPFWDSRQTFIIRCEGRIVLHITK